MALYRDLNRGDTLPASWTDAIQQQISTLVANLDLTLLSATTVRVAASANSGQVCVGIDGLWRYRSTDITATASGVAGTLDIFVSATANSFSNTPLPDTDNTDYNFGLQVLAQGTTPTGVAAFRKVGELEWSGAAITALRQLKGHESATLALTPIAPAATVTPLVAVGAASQSASLIAARATVNGVNVFSVSPTGAVQAASFAVGATLLAASHLSNGVTGTGAVVLAVSPSFTGVPLAPTAAGDTSTAQLATTAFVIGQAGASAPLMAGAVAVGASTRFARDDHRHPTDTSRAPLASPAFTGTMTISGDTNLYRASAGTLKTDGHFVAANGKVCGGANTVGTVCGFTVDVNNHMVLGSTDAGGFGALILRGASAINFQVGGVNAQHLQLTNAGVLLFGSDTTLYRSAANALKTDGTFQVGNAKTVGSSNTVGTVCGFTVDVNNHMVLGSTDAGGFGALILRGASAINFQSGASFIGSYNTSGQFTATAFVVSSDQTLKKNIATVGGGLAKVLALRGVEFDWKDEKGRGKGRRVGFLAQEVNRVVPGAAVQLEDGTLGLNQSDVLPLLVEAIKELTTKVDALQKAA